MLIISSLVLILIMIFEVLIFLPLKCDYLVRVFQMLNMLFKSEHSNVSYFYFSNNYHDCHFHLCYSTHSAISLHVLTYLSSVF